MRFRVILTIFVIAIVHVSLVWSVWWVGQRSAPMVAAPAPAPPSFARLAELYASAAFRSVITFDYAALGELIARSATWSEILYVSVESQDGKIVAHSDPSKIGRAWDPAMIADLKQLHGTAYREITAPMRDGRGNATDSPALGQVRLAYSLSAPPPLPAGPARRQGVPPAVLLILAAALAIPVGVFVSAQGNGSSARRESELREEEIQDLVAQLTREAQQDRTVAADHLARLNEVRAELVESTARLADAEHEVARLREHATQHGDRVRELRAEIDVGAEELDLARAALRDASDTIIELKTRVKHEQDLEADLEELRMVALAREVVAQRQRRAVAYVAHGVRSSLTNVLGFSKVLLRGTDGALNETQRASVQHIHATGDRLLTAVNDVAELNELEHGAVDVKPSAIDVRKLLDETTAATIRLGRSAADVVVEYPTTVPLVKADGARVAQVLAILIEQTPQHASVVLRAGEAGERVALTVSGPPITPSLTLDELCDPFPSAKAGASIQDGGRRVRLAIARRLAVAMGGDLALQHDDAATTFALTLPAAVDALKFA